MVRYALIMVLVVGGLTLHAQEDYIRPGLLKATATIAPSTMLNRSVSNIYINGFIEYHLDDHLSLRGESYFFVDGKSKTATDNLFVHQAMRTYFGAFYHVNRNNWDAHLGFEPGLTLMRPLNTVTNDPQLQACPSFAIHAGTTYYVWKYFNFFLDVAYVKSSYRGLDGGSAKTDELIMSAGLGFQINTKKK